MDSVIVEDFCSKNDVYYRLFYVDKKSGKEYCFQPDGWFYHSFIFNLFEFDLNTFNYKGSPFLDNVKGSKGYQNNDLVKQGNEERMINLGY